MQYIILAYDAKDEKALERRLENRSEHLEDTKKRKESGELLFVSAILDDNEKMIGSLLVVEYESKEKLYEEWICHDPYYINNVWENIVINQAKIPLL